MVRRKNRRARDHPHRRLQSPNVSSEGKKRLWISSEIQHDHIGDWLAALRQAVRGKQPLLYTAYESGLLQCRLQRPGAHRVSDHNSCSQHAANFLEALPSDPRENEICFAFNFAFFTSAPGSVVARALSPVTLQTAAAAPSGSKKPSGSIDSAVPHRTVSAVQFWASRARATRPCSCSGSGS